VCSVVPIPDEVDEDARRSVRERADLVAERVGLVNRIGAVRATLGVRDYDPLRRDRRERLDALRTPLGTELPPHARAKIVRMLDRLELVRAQIAELEQKRDAVLGIGVQSATVPVREAFVRGFASQTNTANGTALDSYAGLTAKPSSNGNTEREQGNRRIRHLHPEQYRLDPKLRRVLAQRRGNLHFVRRIHGQRPDQQALVQEAADAMDAARCPPAGADPRANPRWHPAR